MKKRGSSCRGMLGSKPAWRGPRWQSCWCWSLAALQTPRDALSEKKKGKSSFPAASRPNYPKIPKFQQHSKGSTANYPKIPKFQRHSKGRQPKSHLKPVFYPKRQPHNSSSIPKPGSSEQIPKFVSGRFWLPPQFLLLSMEFSQEFPAIRAGSTPVEQ